MNIQIIQYGKVLVSFGAGNAKRITERAERKAEVYTRLMRDCKRIQSGYYDLHLVDNHGNTIDSQNKSHNMSSLMQFSGSITKQGVGLQFVHIRKVPWYQDLTRDEDVELVPCKECGSQHARIHIAYRKPCGMCGCWVVFRYNGEKHVPDLSIPIGVEKLPRDAKPVSDEENCRIWHT